MRASPRRAALAATVVLLSVALSGCLTVYPAKALFSGEGGGNEVPIELVVAYEQEVTASTFPTSGSDTRTIFVPPLSERVTISVYAKLTSVGAPLEEIDKRHFDFTVADGAGTAWVDVHLRNNSTQKTIIVEGPRPGGWTVTLNYLLQGGVPGFPSDQFHVQVLVAQPAA
ncbi:MAG TPA: hypothetical protein VGB42_01925 [Candidatus Thermoplasmatota archaeon]